MARKDPLVTGEIYHVMNKSIEGFKIFHNKGDYQRMLSLFRFYQFAIKLPKFSQFLEWPRVKHKGFEVILEEMAGGSDQLVDIIAYCIMPTHIHLVIKQLRDDGIAEFMSNILNGYARYFNVKHKRHGPLWVGRFKNVRVQSDEQLLHLTRYLHLNSTSAALVGKPEDWLYSSYNEFIGGKEEVIPLCRYSDQLDIKPSKYKLFVEEYIQNQRNLAILKHVLLD